MIEVKKKIGLAATSAIGIGIGAGTGAALSDDGYLSGALRGGIAGGAIGSAFNLVPRAINAAYKDAGFTRLEDGVFSQWRDDAVKAFRPTYDSVNNDANKSLMKSFGGAAKRANKESMNNKEFAQNIVKNMSATVKDLSAEDMGKLQNIGSTMGKDMQKLHESPHHKAVDDFLEKNVKAFGELSKGKKVGVMTAAVIDGSINSVKNHLIDPVKDLGSKLKDGRFKDIRPFHEGGAVAFNAYGLYEGGHVANDIADGNYGSAAKGLAVLGGMKLAYGQGANAISGAKYMYDNNLNPFKLKNAAIAGVGMKKLDLGVKAMDEAEQMAFFNSITNTTKAF